MAVLHTRSVQIEHLDALFVLAALALKLLDLLSNLRLHEETVSHARPDTHTGQIWDVS
jgi:hypothetical protein